MSPLYPNVSYHLDFYGPAVKCVRSADDASIRNISIRFESNLNSGDGYDFASWAGPVNGTDWYQDGNSDPFPAATIDTDSRACRLTIATGGGNWSQIYEVP